MTGELHKLKHDIIIHGRELEFFHASNDPVPVRKRVYSVLNQFSHYRVDTIAVEKAKTNPALYEVGRFYPRILKILFNWVFKFQPASSHNRVILFIDYLELARDREALLKGTKEAIMPHLTQGQRLDVFMHQSKSHFYLQAVDYFCWAMFRKYEFGDTSYLALIPSKINSDFDVFALGTTRWY
jgi:hypothetical protein